MTTPDARFGAVLVVVATLLYASLGLYKGIGPSPCERLRLRASAVLLLATFICTSRIAIGDYELVPFIAFSCLLLLVIGYYAEAVARIFLIWRDVWAAPAVFVGCAQASRRLARFLTQHPEFGIKPVGGVYTLGEDNGPGGWPLPALSEIDLETVASPVEILVFGSAEDAAALGLDWRRRLNATELLIAGPGGFGQLQTLWVNTRTLGDVIGIELRCDRRRNWNRIIKRLMDLTLAIPSCIIAAPIIALAAAAIRLADGGPSFYVQERVGENGSRIRVWKLRTMYKDAEDRLAAQLAADPQARLQWQRYFKLADDPRILPGMGSFLRRTSLDELPQLWAVVRGQMSLVGPRPLPTYHVTSFDQEFQAIRSAVLPGLSGLWQVGARSDGDLEVQRAQDLFYILNWSIWLDLYVLMETPLAVLCERGAR
jgi:lipopolysaccharide/colanic/teichoic acid biosynthesis glycosyltransferase